MVIVVDYQQREIYRRESGLLSVEEQADIREKLSTLDAKNSDDIVKRGKKLLKGNSHEKKRR